MSSIEFELKLALTSAGLKALKAHPLIQPFLAGSTTKRLVGTYYDTPDQALRSLGATLRVRKIGRRHVQTLKLTADGTIAALSRHEWEFEVPGPVPEPDLLRPIPLPDKVARALAEGPLVPQFTTDVRRTATMIGFGQAMIELALDTGNVHREDARAAISEAELELKHGDRTAVYQLARRLADTVPFRFDPTPKSARGYALVDGTRPEVAHADTPPLEEGQTVAQAFATIARECLRHLLGAEWAARAGEDPEGVHQTRVALRRLRSAFKLFAPVFEGDKEAERLTAELSWLAGELGPARDWDVFLGDIMAPLMARRADDKDLARLVQSCRRKRDEAYVAVRTALGEARYNQLILDLLLWLEREDWPQAAAAPIEDFAGALLHTRRKKLRKLGRRHAELAAEDLHRVRIRAKTMRYAAEFFRALYPKKAVRKQLAALSGLQDVLGVLNDAAVGEGLMAKAAKERSASNAKAAAVVDGWYAALTHDHLSRLPEAWAAFDDLKPYWSVPEADETSDRHS
ncbi:MAG: CYTH and CHAD domain-containing protein [Ferrovibrionaceae bacterium]